jgi:gliding motility-associated protein GldM
MSLPKEPRQQMINMMYLVLTAMLALNITREVLNAFQTINSSIELSNSSITDKNNFYYEQFNKAEENEADAAKVKPWNDMAKEIKAKSEELVEYLQSWKDSVIVQSGGYETNSIGEQVIKSIEDIDASTRIFVENKHGVEIKNRLNEYADFIISKLPDSVRESMRKQLINIPDKLPVTEENKSGDWVYGTFHNIPVVASIAMLSKFQNDVKNSEATVVKYLFEQIHATDLKFEELMPFAVPNNSYVLAGDEIEAKIAVVAYNKSINPTITSNRGAVQVENGMGTLKFKATGTGVMPVNGRISLKTQQGERNFDYKFDIMVGSAGASLQIDKMNVMYIGVPNPVTISASGYRIEDVYPTFPDGITAKKISEGHYDVDVTKEGLVQYSIMAKAKGGSGTTKIGSGEIRVKSIPTPNAYVGGKMNGRITTSELKSQIGIVAKLPDFVYDAIFRVTSYRFALLRRNGDYKELEASSYKFDGPVLDLINSAKPGDKVFFDEIKAIGPDKRTRTLNTISLTLN